jgi:hypothetical protein
MSGFTEKKPPLRLEDGEKKKKKKKLECQWTDRLAAERAKDINGVFVSLSEKRYGSHSVYAYHNQ